MFIKLFSVLLVPLHLPPPQQTHPSPQLEASYEQENSLVPRGNPRASPFAWGILATPYGIDSGHQRVGGWTEELKQRMGLPSWNPRVWE